MTVRHILCPIDFSETSQRALDHALAIAGWYHSSITVLYVCPALPVTAGGPGETRLPPSFLTPATREALLASMTRFVPGIENVPDVRADFQIAEGDVTAEILAAAGAMPIDLLVMGTHGRSGFERFVLGSVTEKVLRKAVCPVLSVPPHTADVVPAVTFRRILCAIDFSDCSMRALDFAMSLAQEAGGRLTVVNVLELPPEMPQDAYDSVVTAPRTLSEYIGSAREDHRTRLLEAVPEGLRARGTVEPIVATGKPYREILRIAGDQQSDLIVIGIHGRGATDLLFFGSTAQHVVRRAVCPVLTLRSG